MGHYLSFSFSRPGEESIQEILAPVFGGSFFQPVAVGAVDGGASTGYHWFLAGYALEEFLRIYCERGVPRLASVALANSLDAEVNVYQQQCADVLKRASPLLRLRSPFEQVDAQAGVTVLEPKQLSEEVLFPLTRWAERFRHASVHVYGAIALSLQRPAESTWGRAFRAVDPTDVSQLKWTAPFLTLDCRVTGPDEGWWISIVSRDPIWQSQVHALSGRVTPEDADANLRGLASFVRALRQGESVARSPAELHLEGSIFWREEARFRAAFKDLL